LARRIVGRGRRDGVRAREDRPDHSATIPGAIIGLGVPFGTFATGFAMMMAKFWPGIMIMAAPLPIFWWTTDHHFSRRENPKRWSGYIFSLIFWLFYVPAKSHLLGSLTYDLGDYAEGLDRYGIIWNKRYSEIIFDLRNNSDADFTNIDAYLWVDSQIITAGIAKGINTCTWESYQPIPVGAASLKVTNVRGLSEIPLAQDKWNSPIYHIPMRQDSSK
jgi:hypothetical protein